MTDRLKSKFIKSILYFAFSHTFGRIVNALAFMILLSKLSPEEIGLVSIAAVFVTILGAVSELGFEAAVIQARNITERQKSGVFWIGLGLASLAYITVFFASPLIAEFYSEPLLESLIKVYLVVLFVNALRIIPYSLLVRDLQFGKISLIESLPMLVSSCLMVFLAFRGYGPWSLVIADLVRTAGILIGSQIALFYVPGLRFSLKEVSPLVRFGFFATASRILYNFYSNIDYLIVGKFFGAATVGIYSVAYRLAFETLKAGTGIVNKVAYPTFARIQHDLSRLKRYFFSIARTNLSVLGLFLVFVAFFSDWAMLIFGYEKWLAAVPIIRLFCIIGLLRCIVPLIPQLLNALGHSRLNFYYSALCAAAMPLAFYGGARISIFGVVWAWIIFYPLVVSLLFYYALKYLRISLRDFVVEFISPFKILLMTSSAVFLIRIGFEKIGAGPKFPLVAAAVLLSLVFGLFSIYLFDKTLAQEILQRLRRKK